MNKKEVIFIQGMKCVNCALRIEKALVGVKGVIKSTVDHVAKQATVEFNENEASIEDFKKAIIDVGYQVND